MPVSTATPSEDACHSHKPCSLYRSEEDQAVMVGLERWKSKEDHDRHLQGAHFQKLAAAMGDIVAGPPQIGWHEIIDEE